MITTILKLGGDQQSQALITQQLELYQNNIGDFKLGVKQANNLSPVEWWRRYGNQCPELQRFAIKILGLSCNGASSYELRRDNAKKLLSTSEFDPAYKMLMEFNFVSYNLHLKDLKKSGTKFNIEANQIDPFDDWIAGEY
ncbi:putative ABC transporter ATP-binding protein YwjA [Bienertia sinuspersici]